MTAVSKAVEPPPASPAQDEDVPEPQIAAILESRFGDGMVYLPRNRPRHLFDQAIARGFIDAEGYLTRKGRTLLARYHYL